MAIKNRPHPGDMLPTPNKGPFTAPPPELIKARGGNKGAWWMEPDEYDRAMGHQEAVQRYANAALAPETKRAFFKNWRRWEAWCHHQGHKPLPAHHLSVTAYLSGMADAGYSVATINQALWAIDRGHQLGGHPKPGDREEVRLVMAGIRRQRGAPPAAKQALTLTDLQRMAFGQDLRSLRNRALLLVGFASGLRRSELAALATRDVEPTAHGIRLHITRSKTNQTGQRETVDVVRAQKNPAWCPVAALNAYLLAGQITDGRLFRAIDRQERVGKGLSPTTVGKLVKQAADRAGLDAARYGGHSLRSGCATYLLDHQVPLNVVAKQLRHKRTDTTLKYDRNETARQLEGVY